MGLKVKAKFIDELMFEQEIPSGAIDSVNTTFTLSFTPISSTRQKNKFYLIKKIMLIVVNYHRILLILINLTWVQNPAKTIKKALK